MFDLIMTGQENKENIKADLLNVTRLILDPADIPFDLRMSNVISTCLEYD